MKLYFAVLIIFLVRTESFSQKINWNNSSEKVNYEEKIKWNYIEESTIPINLTTIKKIRKWQPIKQFPIIFSETAKAVWIKTCFENKISINQTYHIITKGVDSLNCYWTTGYKSDSLITGKFIPLFERPVPSQYLVIPIKVPRNSLTEVYVRVYIQGYPLSLPYMKVLNLNESNKFIRNGELGNNIYWGGLFLMLVFSIILYAFFKEPLYLYYLFCLIVSLTMAGIYNDYSYIIFQKSPEFFRNKNVFAVLTTFVNIFYLLFAEQYLNVITHKSSWIIKISRLIIVLLLVLLIFLIVIGKELFDFRAFFYPLFAVNTLIMYYHLLSSIKKKYSPSWYFLIATTPVAAVSILEITSGFNRIPIQTMHDYYYLGTFVEMFFLTIGIVYRFRMERTEAKLLQQELIITETKTQDQERGRIAKDLHDNIGASIVGIQYQLDEFADKYFPDKNTPLDFQKTLSSLEQTYKDVRGLSYDLTPQVLTDMGLFEQLRQKFGSMAKPVFKLSLPTQKVELSPFIELTLYKIINEAVGNILKYAKSTEVGIDIVVEKEIVKLRIDDNGIGFDMDNFRVGTGLNNMKFRAETQLNGTFNIESSPGNGTIISVKVSTKNAKK